MNFFPADFGYHSGYVGAFSRQEAPGAWPNATRVRKIAGAEEGGQPLGAEGAVLGSLHSDELGFAYFVEWDAAPGMAVAVVAFKIEPIGKA